MREIFGFSPKYTTQEKVTRLALSFCLLIMTIMPLPFCIWNPVGWVAFAIYLLPMCFGLYPLKAKELSEKRTFHWLIGGTLIIVALSVSTSIFCLPFFFVLLTLYLTYWQLEKRLYAIRKALENYDFSEIESSYIKDLVSKLVKSSLGKSLLPATMGTIACAVGLLPYPFGALVLITVFCMVIFLMHRKLAIFSKSDT